MDFITEIKLAMNKMDLKTLGGLLTEESKENIVQVLSQNDEDFAALAAQGKSYADLYNEVTKKWDDFSVLADHALESSDWVDLNFNLADAKISSFRRNAVVPY